MDHTIQITHHKALSQHDRVTELTVQQLLILPSQLTCAQAIGIQLTIHRRNKYLVTRYFWTVGTAGIFTPHYTLCSQISDCDLSLETGGDQILPRNHWIAHNVNQALNV